MRIRSVLLPVVAVLALVTGVVTVVSAVPAGAATTLTVTPTSGLVGGQSVAVHGSGLTPGATAGWCEGVAGPAGATPGEGWCGVGVNGTGPVAADGTFGAPLRLQRFIYVPNLAEWVDCAATSQQCIIGGADLADIAGTAAVAPIAFAPPPAPPATRGAISLTPATDVHPDQAIIVRGSGFRARAAVDLFQCFPGAVVPADPSSCGLLRATLRARADGSFSVRLAIQQVLVDAPAIVGQGGTTYDCVAAPSGPCRVVAAEAADFPGTAVASPVAMTPQPPTVLPGVASISEGNSGTTSLEVPVTLSFAWTTTVTAAWNTLFVTGAPGDQADPASDYTSASGTVTFAPGETSKTVTVLVSGDTLVEPDEAIVVSFHDPTNAVMGGFWGLGFGVITNDD